MAEPIVIGAALVVGACGASVIHSWIASKSNDSEGCNGHHWEEKMRRGTGLVFPRHNAFIEDAEHAAKTEHLSTDFRGGKLRVKEDVVVECEDCGARRTKKKVAFVIDNDELTKRVDNE